MTRTDTHGKERSFSLGPLLLILLLAAGGWFLFLRDRSPTRWPVTNDPPRAGTTIVALGDSLTECFAVKDEDCYWAVLSRRIGRPIINAGVSGNTTEDALKRLDRDVLAHDPRVVIVLLGGNNMLRRQKAEDAAVALRAIIRGIQERGALVILVGVEGYAAFGHDDYGAVWARVAREMGCVWVPDILDGIVGSPSKMADNIHPNAAGHRVMEEKIWRLAGEYLTR